MFEMFENFMKCLKILKQLHDECNMRNYLTTIVLTKESKIPW